MKPRLVSITQIYHYSDGSVKTHTRLPSDHMTHPKRDKLGRFKGNGLRRPAMCIHAAACRMFEAP